MIKIECGDCRCDLNTGDVVFCDGCYAKLEYTIEVLEADTEGLKAEIEKLEGEKNDNVRKT